MQSTTVDGWDGRSRPPSSTRSAPREIASRHSCTTVVADCAAGLPGRFALVDVIGSPYARISVFNPRCDVQRTPMPP